MLSVCYLNYSFVLDNSWQNVFPVGHSKSFFKKKSVSYFIDAELWSGRNMLEHDHYNFLHSTERKQKSFIHHPTLFRNK